jgi:hypothetical protein
VREAFSAESSASAPSTAAKAKPTAANSSSSKKPRLRDASAAAPTASGRAAWDIEDGEPDIFEQRAMALMKATGGVHPASSEDESVSAGKKKSTKRAASDGRKGLVKRPKTASRKVEAPSDDEDAMFGAGDKEEMAVEETQTEQQRAAQRAAINKKRSLRIESDDEE